jgi:ubiquinone/menaquinone biosynthesis C-methylase UbiE
MPKSGHAVPSKESLKQQYDDRYVGDYMDVDAYSTWAHEGLADYRVRQTLQQIGGNPRRILDYGCGQGKWTPLLRSIYPDAEIVGIDISAVAIAKASQKFPQYQFLVFDGERAGLEDSSFDLVFSFHVLEHVLDVASSIRDIERLLRPGGHACIIFPCGNKNSFEDRLMNLMQDGRRLSATGESVFFFEVSDGHLRRMPSEQTIALFKQQGLAVHTEFYSGQLFAALDWLVRGTGPAYINQFFRSCVPVGRLAAIKLATMRRLFLFLHRFLGYRRLDTTKPRPILKQIAVRLTQKIAAIADRSILKLARWEWDHRRHRKNGSAQYLVFAKSGVAK